MGSAVSAGFGFSFKRNGYCSRIVLFSSIVKIDILRGEYWILHDWNTNPAF
jgi:hypothetical protein